MKGCVKTESLILIIDMRFSLDKSYQTFAYIVQPEFFFYIILHRQSVGHFNLLSDILSMAALYITSDLES